MSAGSFPEVRRPGCGVGQPPRSSAEVKEEYSYISTPPLGLRGLFYGEFYTYLYLTTPHCVTEIDRNIHD